MKQTLLSSNPKKINYANFVYDKNNFEELIHTNNLEMIFITILIGIIALRKGLT